MQLDYSTFLNSKRHVGSKHGFEPTFIPDALFDFQKFLVEWSIEKGRAALFEDCGMGKTIQELVWGENVHRHTNKPVLLLTPLAVSEQTQREGEKFGIPCFRSRNGEIKNGINIANYEKLHKFNPNDFAGVICDESSILKNFDGSRKHDITKFMRKMPYRLLATATAAPNDYIELGTSSEALGELGHIDMLSRFFKNDNNNVATKRMYGKAPKWRFKGHSELLFWRWVVTWARAIRKPSDIGFDDGDFNLPELIVNTYEMTPETSPDGTLFTVPAFTLKEQRDETKRTIDERCERVCELVSDKDTSLIWCNRNDEGNLLSDIIPDAVQITGSDSDEKKEEAFIAFANGEINRLITKPRIGAWGLNFQNCNHMTYFPTHSYEGYYQAVRRCWRFGQKRPVTVDIVLTEGEKRIQANLENKSKAASAMFVKLINEMNNAQEVITTETLEKEVIPSWV